MNSEDKTRLHPKLTVIWAQVEGNSVRLSGLLDDTLYAGVIHLVGVPTMEEEE